MSDTIEGFTRRKFLGTSLAASTVLGTGCKPKWEACAPEEGRKQSCTISTRVRIKPGERGALQQALEDHVFANPGHGVHYARFVLQKSDYLIFSTIYDGHRGYPVRFLHNNAESVDKVFRHCEGYQPETAYDLKGLNKYLKDTRMRALLLYAGYEAPSHEIRETLEFREFFIQKLQVWQQDPLTRGIVWNEILNHPAILAPAGEAEPEEREARQLIIPPSQTNAFTMITPIKKGKVETVKFMLTAGEWAIRKFDIHPLGGIDTLHFARFGLIDGDKLFFASVYDGDWMQYVEDFGTKIPGKLDKAWGNAKGYPKKGARDVKGLTKFLNAHKVPSDALYGSYFGRTVKDVRASLDFNHAFTRILKKYRKANHESIMQTFLKENQTLLG